MLRLVVLSFCAFVACDAYSVSQHLFAALRSEKYTGLTLNAIADELVGFVVGKIGQQQRIEDQVLKATHAVPAAQITFSNGSYNDLKSLHRNGNVKLLNGTSISGGFLNVSLFVRIPLALNKSQAIFNFNATILDLPFSGKASSDLIGAESYAIVDINFTSSSNRITLREFHLDSKVVKVKYDHKYSNLLRYYFGYGEPRLRSVLDGKSKAILEASFRNLLI